MTITNEIPSKIRSLNVTADIFLLLLIQINNIVDSTQVSALPETTNHHKSGKIHPDL